MHRFLLLAVFLAACSSSSEYERGTFARPPPTAPGFRPELDAPHTTGQPGHQPGRSGVQRGKDRRELPASAAPAIYAADGDVQRGAMLEINAPVEDAPGGLPESAWERCWQDVKALLLSSEEVAALTRAKVRCLRAKLMSQCGQYLIGRAQKGDESVLGRHPGDYSIEDFEEELSERQEGQCRGGRESTKGVVSLFRRLSEDGRERMGWRE